MCLDCGLIPRMFFTGHLPWIGTVKNPIPRYEDYSKGSGVPRDFGLLKIGKPLKLSLSHCA